MNLKLDNPDPMRLGMAVLVGSRLLAQLANHPNGGKILARPCTCVKRPMRVSANVSPRTVKIT